MKSFCIKNNNIVILDYLLNKFQSMDLEDVFISENKFKYYKNIIVHYTGKYESRFVAEVSDVLTDCILFFYEKNIVKRFINSDYFYFDSREKSCIYKNCFELLNNEDSDEYSLRREKVYKCLYEYISNNKFFILDGFVNFRLFEYNAIVEENVDSAVNKFIIEKEYKEFISLLQGYIKSQNSKTKTIHIIYSNNEPILLDEDKNVLLYDNQFNHPKYLSDISFSSKDYCLNALLNLIPQKLVVHLLVEEDEFIETLKLIFENRLVICRECDICKTFSLINVH